MTTTSPASAAATGGASDGSPAVSGATLDVDVDSAVEVAGAVELDVEVDVSATDVELDVGSPGASGVSVVDEPVVVDDDVSATVVGGVVVGSGTGSAPAPAPVTVIAPNAATQAAVHISAARVKLRRRRVARPCSIVSMELSTFRPGISGRRPARARRFASAPRKPTRPGQRTCSGPIHAVIHPHAAVLTPRVPSVGGAGGHRVKAKVRPKVNSEVKSTIDPGRRSRAIGLGDTVPEHWPMQWYRGAARVGRERAVPRRASARPRTLAPDGGSGGRMTQGWVQRQRLFDLLAPSTPLRVITAPGGYGKSTLLRSWVDSLPDPDRPLVWLTLSDIATTRRGFWKLAVSSALRRGDLSNEAFRSITRSIEAHDDPVPAIVEFFRSCTPALLAVDAYEHLRELTEEIDDDFIRLVKTLPGLEIVVTTRAATRLVDDGLVLSGLVRVIDENELRFTTDEVEQVLAVHAPHAADAARRICQDTRGYPLAVRAVAYALSQQAQTPVFDSDSWRRLLTADLASQIADPELVEFVLDTCAPPYFDRELAACLAQRSDGDAIDRALAELAWNGFGRWAPYARDRPVFHYLDSVRESFVPRLKAEQPDRYVRAASIAAEWLHRHDDHELALASAIDAGDFALASTICRRLVTSNPDVYTTTQFEAHLRRVPMTSLARYPVLAFIRGMVCAANPATRGSAGDFWRIAATHALDGVDELDPVEVFYRYIGREVSLRLLGRSREAGETATDALEFFESMPAASRDELGEFTTMALSILAYSQLQVGDLERAREVVERAIAAAVSPWWKNYALSFAAGIYALDGRVFDATTALQMIDPNPSPVGTNRPLPHTIGALGAAAVQLDEFQFTEADRVFAAAEVNPEAAESWPGIMWVRMHAALGRGESAVEAHRVEAALASQPRRPGMGPSLMTAALVNALAILMLANGRVDRCRQLLLCHPTPHTAQLAPAKLAYELVAGDPAAAVRMVAGMLAEPGHTVRSASAVDTLGAAAALRVGHRSTAVELLERAAVRYDLFGVRAHLLYVPDVDVDALRSLAFAEGTATSQAYLGGYTPAPIAAVGPATVSLTRREVEVLKAWSRHSTRAEVAAELFVSTNTVSSQLRSSYRKLGVHTKDDALQRAIELDLLPRSTT